jgi:RNA polymerase sigma factor (sigma-70 family)
MAGKERTAGIGVRPEALYAEDVALVARCLNGDRAAWAQLLTEHEAVIHFTVRSVLASHLGFAAEHLIEDVQADVVLALVAGDCHRLRSWSGRCKLRSWLKVVAHHLAIDRLRRRRRKTISLDDDSRPLRDHLEDQGPGPDQQIADRDRMKRVFALAESLPEEDRAFVALFLGEGLDFAEIAQRMGTTMGAVYARKNRVRKKLTQMYADDCQDSQKGSS